MWQRESDDKPRHGYVMCGASSRGCVNKCRDVQNSANIHSIVRTSARAIYYEAHCNMKLLRQASGTALKLSLEQERDEASNQQRQPHKRMPYIVTILRLRSPRSRKTRATRPATTNTSTILNSRAPGPTPTDRLHVVLFLKLRRLIANYHSS